MKDSIKYKNIVATFDGWELKHNPSTNQKCWFKKGLGHHLKKDWVFDYKTNWNSLMPVVKKIYDMHDQRTYILVGHIFEEIQNNLYSVNIKELYKNVIDFIEHFNSDEEDFFIEYK